jgi:hypothetical protein
MSTTNRPHIDKDKLKQKLDVSHFDLNAILRGVQLTLVGGVSGPKPIAPEIQF